jgi:peptidoglycan-associated lipoprotein
MKQIYRVMAIGLCAGVLAACSTGSHKGSFANGASGDTTTRGLGQDSSFLDTASAIPGAAGNSKNTVYFDLNKYNIGTQYQGVVDQFAAYLVKNPDVKINIAGYTDKSGSRSWNLSLSQLRSKSVAKALQAQGVKANQIQTIGYGEEYPLPVCQDRIVCQEERRAVISPLG